jgi:hypothetical protein
MRNDLATMRMAFVHTRTDAWPDAKHAQDTTYGYSMWYLLGGTGFGNMTDEYDIRSRLTTGIGIGFDLKSGTDTAALLTALREWMDQASYMLYDYYPLTDYDQKLTSIYPKELTPNAVYQIWSVDDPDHVSTLTGRQLMEQGLSLSGTAQCALIYKYQRQN